MGVQFVLWGEKMKAFFLVAFHEFRDMFLDWPVGTIVSLIITSVLVVLVIVLVGTFRSDGTSSTSENADPTLDLVDSQANLNTTIESMNTVIDNTSHITHM